MVNRKHITREELAKLTSFLPLGPIRAGIEFIGGVLGGVYLYGKCVEKGNKICRDKGRQKRRSVIKLAHNHHNQSEIR
jgi:hypothetical protein